MFKYLNNVSRNAQQLCDYFMYAQVRFFRKQFDTFSIVKLLRYF